MFNLETISLKSNLKIQGGSLVGLTASLSDTRTEKPILLVFHGLSSDTQLTNWWERFNWHEVEKTYRIICVNTIGSAFGSTGPSDFTFVNHKGEFSKTFPSISVSDSVNFAIQVLREKGINSVDSVLGCSLGGMQVIDMYVNHPDFAEKFISTCACELPASTKLYNNAQFAMLDEAISTNSTQAVRFAYKFARFFFRLSCTTNGGIVNFENSLMEKNANPPLNVTKVDNCLKYYLADGEKYFDNFPVASYLTIMRMVSGFQLDVERVKNIRSKLLLVGISDDQFTPPKEIKDLSEKLKNNNNQVSYLEFKSVFGHEAWILDGEKFYEFLEPFLY